MDTRTLALTILIVMVSLSILGLAVATMRKDKFVWVCVSGFSGSTLGMGLLLFQTNPFGHFVLGGSLLLSFHFSIVYAMGIFFSVRRPWKIRFFVYLAGFLAGVVLFTLLFPSFQWRAALFSGWAVVLSVEIQVLLGRHRSALPKLVQGLLWGTTSVFILFHGFRTVAALQTSAPSLFEDQFLTVPTFLVNLVGIIFLAGILIFMDLSRTLAKLKSDADELERLNRLKDRILAMSSHDLRGPLGNLKMLWGEIEARLREGQCPGIDADLMKMMDQSLGGSQSLLENLFDFAEYQSAIPGQKQSTDLVMAVRNVIDQWEGPAEVKGIRLEAVDLPAQVLVTAGVEPVAAVLRNVVGNSVKFTPSGGTVQVGITVDPADKAVVTVADTGVGMAPELLEKTLRMEKRVSRPGTGGERGSGFGLILVREMVEGWGGTWTVESAPGKGTTVRITVPAQT